MAILAEGETRCPRNVSDKTDIDKLPNSYPGQSPIQRVRVIQHMDLLESIARIAKTHASLRFMAVLVSSF